MVYKILLYIFLEIINVESPDIADKKGVHEKKEPLYVFFNYYKCHTYKYVQDMKKHADLIHDIEKSVDGGKTS